MAKYTKDEIAAGGAKHRKVLKKGDTGADVAWAQTRVNWHMGAPRIVPDGDFGPATEKRVKDFQAKYNLQVDGIIGPITFVALKSAKGQVVKPVPVVKPPTQSFRPKIFTKAQLGLREARGRTPVRWYKDMFHVVHYPAMADPVKTLAQAKRAWQSFQNYHMNSLGWNDIGYNFGLTPMGHIFEGRGKGLRGAHTGNSYGKPGDPNSHPGFCFLNANNQPLTERQFIAYEYLCDYLDLDPKNWRAHFVFDNTSCPGKHIPRQLKARYG